MLKNSKHLLIPLLGFSAALAIVLCFLFSINYGPSENEIITVYCVAKITHSAPLGNNAVYTYDEKGRFLEISKHNGKITQKYSYDKYGNPTHYPYPGGGNAAATYDKNGNMLTLKRYYSDITKPDMENIYTYDKKGKLIETVSYSNGALSIIDRNTYNKNGDLITRSREYARNNSVPIEYIRADYDENGNLTSFKIYFGERLRIHDEYAYDTAGRIIATTQIRDDKIVRKQEYVYDLTGRLVQMNSYTPGQTSAELPCTIVDYEYDSFSNLVKSTSTENGKQYIIQWNYDRNGNLISYDNGISVRKWYYDSYGNIVKEEQISKNYISSTEYTYETFQVTRKEAEFIKSQQEDIFSLPFGDVTPKTYMAQLEEQ